jgi:hypothetical protein
MNIACGSWNVRAPAARRGAGRQAHFVCVLTCCLFDRQLNWKFASCAAVDRRRGRGARREHAEPVVAAEAELDRDGASGVPAIDRRRVADGREELVATSNTVMVFAAASVTYRTYGSAQ